MISHSLTQAMEDLVDKGLARSIGISNFNVQQLSRLLKASPRIKPANMQVGGPTHESIYIGRFRRGC